jgi:hypothetical protein
MGKPGKTRVSRHTGRRASPAERAERGPATVRQQNGAERGHPPTDDLRPLGQSLARTSLAFDNSGMETPNRGPWWRCVRLKLRTLVVLVLFVGTWLGWSVRQANIQRNAVKAIQKVGGNVWYDRFVPHWTSGSRWCPDWLVDRVGIDYFATVCWAYLDKPGLDANLAMPHVAQLDRLDHLDLSESSISDAGLHYLRDLSSLESLYLARTGITDAELVHLEPLRRLEILSLDRTAVTNKGLIDTEHEFSSALKRLKGDTNRISFLV